MSTAITEQDYFEHTFKALEARGQQFYDISFEACEFKSCDLSEALFNNCRFLDCDFNGCNLSAIALNNCRFNDTRFKNCKLLGVDWGKVAWPNIVLVDLVSFEQCILNDSSFHGLTLKGLKLVDCRLLEVDFREGSFVDADFSYSDFTGSLFNRTTLTAVNFCEATNYSIDINNNFIKGAKFTRIEALSLLDGLEIELFD